MERVHKCKVCLKRFSNGRALGGHMRSHMVNIVAPPLPQGGHHDHDLMADSALWSSAPSSSSEGYDDEQDQEEKGLCYGLRENPKRSIRMVDPEFSFAASSVVVQDGESETESSKNPRRRSKRRMRMRMKMTTMDHVYNQNQTKQMKEKESEAEAGSSSISGTTTEEDVAFWLMMLSRDKWMEEEESDDEDSDDSQGLKLSKPRNNRGRYECETCNKVFGSYQALGGHRASHKKIKAHVVDQRNNATTIIRSHQIKKIHECPVCFRVFASGQALGGHKRSHVAGFSLKTPPPSRQSFIDLNLPAPFDEDDLSALSDAHFINNNNAVTH